MVTDYCESSPFVKYSRLCSVNMKFDSFPQIKKKIHIAILDMNRRFIIENQNISEMFPQCDCNTPNFYHILRNIYDVLGLNLHWDASLSSRPSLQRCCAACCTSLLMFHPPVGTPDVEGAGSAHNEQSNCGSHGQL